MEGVFRLTVISLLLTARKDSKFLAKFIMAYLVQTRDYTNVELLILTPDGEWNRDLKTWFDNRCGIRFFNDTTDLGRGGSHIFYQELAKYAKGEWLWYLCDDHMLLPGYDKYLTDFIKERSLIPSRVNVIVPMVDNSGWITHILSRRWVETVGFAKQGNVDSYINETHEYLEMLAGHQSFLHITDKPLVHDHSLDKDLFTSPPFDAEYEKALFKSPEIKEKIVQDAKELYKIL